MSGWLSRSVKATGATRHGRIERIHHVHHMEGDLKAASQPSETEFQFCGFHATVSCRQDHQLREVLPHGFWRMGRWPLFPFCGTKEPERKREYSKGCTCFGLTIAKGVLTFSSQLLSIPNFGNSRILRSHSPEIFQRQYQDE